MWSLDLSALSTLFSQIRASRPMFSVAPTQWWLLNSLLQAEQPPAHSTLPLAFAGNSNLTCSKPNLCQVCSSSSGSHLSNWHHRALTPTPHRVLLARSNSDPNPPSRHLLSCPTHRHSAPASLPRSRRPAFLPHGLSTLSNLSNPGKT